MVRTNLIIVNPPRAWPPTALPHLRPRAWGSSHTPNPFVPVTKIVREVALQATDVAIIRPEVRPVMRRIRHTGIDASSAKSAQIRDQSVGGIAGD